ncbi:hypothetical protein V757_00800 [Pelistega indica]|uniref:Nucleotide pyrophosphatase n=1 Tax=Pelistega indica TaxID=1414851 RepID=V8GBA9_9BURK|nr:MULTISPECIES: alkaline phosphatase family protein [Pelistega]ETD73027.1 hypothetical protein V757_00800 [Pelistega indica]
MKHQKVILVILDGLTYRVAADMMGYLQAECNEKKGCLYQLRCELPSISRPLYECILTGKKPVESGIVNNQVTRLSTQKSIFHYAHEAGLKTAAAAYAWISELYNRTPFNPLVDRHVEDESLPIQYGHFYYEDHYPDNHLFADAEHLRRTKQPDFLLIHPMNIDDAGHRFGKDSKAYRNSARRADDYLSHYLPTWLEEGYQVLVTSDHGMSDEGSHGGLDDDECLVPLFAFGNCFSLTQASILQTELCGTVCQLLGVPHDKPVAQQMLIDEK